MSTARKFIKSWKTQDTVAAEKRKRPITGDFFDIDDPRKRARAEWERDKGTVKGDREYKIRGASDSGSGAGAPLSTHHRREYPNSRDSLPSPSIRDGRQQIINKTATTSRNNRAYPLSPLSRSPEHLSDGVATSAITEDSPERRRRK